MIPADPTVVCLATTARGPGGVWRHVCDLARGLQDRGVTVRVDLPRDATALVADAARRDLPVGGHAGAGEIYHAHLANTYDRVLTARMTRARLAGARVIMTEHLPRTDASDVRLAVRPPRIGATSAKTALKQAQIAVAHAVIAVSSGSAEFLAERYRIAPDRLHVVFNGVPSLEVAPQADPGDVHVFAATGSVIFQKGFDLLVDAGRMATRDWRVDVYGEGPQRVQLAARASEVLRADGSPRVVFHGWTEEAARHVGAATALVMPSRWEAMPYSALEAMSLARPVIATTVDGLVDAVVPGVTGALATPDAASIAAVLDDFCANLDRADAQGRAGQQRVRERFDIETMITRTLEIYAKAPQPAEAGSSR